MTSAVENEKDQPDTTTSRLGIYLQDEVSYGKLDFIAGVRYDNYDLDAEADAIFLASSDVGTPLAADHSSDALSPSLVASYNWNPSFSTYAKYANIPTNSASYFYLFPYLLLNRNSPLFISLKRLHKTIPWIAKYLSNCRKKRVDHTIEHLTTLLLQMDSGYEDLFKEAEVEKYISRESIMYGWSTKIFFNSAKKDFYKREKTGIKTTILSHDDISDLEPNINNIFYKGALFEGSYFAKSPIKVSEALMRLLLNKGGEFKKEKVVSITMTDNNKVNVKTDIGSTIFDKVVITSGIWSKDITDKIGDKVPLESERGYHLVNPELKNIVDRPISWQERGTYFTPMTDGLRTGGIVEFGALDDKKNDKVLKFLNRSCLLYTSPSPRDRTRSRMPSSA